jgi:7-keto-8-aminopelargonate synthetase-like enzyme
MPTIDHHPGRSILVNGEEWLHFSGTSYLGMASHSQFQNLVMEGIQKYGINFGGSRRSNLQLGIFQEAESYLAEWLGVEAVLTVSSGSLAGQLLIKYLEEEHVCNYAPSIHPALVGQGSLFRGSMEEWIHFIADFEAPPQQILLSSTVDPLFAVAYDFEWLTRLSPKKHTTLVIDDSHGLGILGEDGRGSLHQLPKAPHLEYILVSSMGKALGVPGGLIGGSKALISQLWASPFFGGASPIIPAYLHAFMKSQSLLQQQRKQLQQNIQFFTKVNPAPKYFQQIPGHPVFYIKETGLVNFLAQNKILISSFNYPAAKDPLVSRIVLSAAHTQDDLQKLTTLIQHYQQRQ